MPAATCLRLRAWTADAVLLQFGELALDPVRAELVQNVELLPARGFRTPIGQIDDHPLFDAIDCRVRLVHEVLQAFGEPMITPRLAAIATPKSRSSRA